MILYADYRESGYYNTPEGAPCYCEQLTYAADLTLQAPVTANFTSGYSLTVNVLSADGLTLLEDATAYFEWYVAQNPVTGGKFLNVRLKAFSPAMCSEKCWIIQIILTNGGYGLNRYTDRYCLSSCCDIPRNILIEQDGVRIGFRTINFDPVDPSTIGGNPGIPSDTPTTTTVLQPVTPCGDPVIRITADWACFDTGSGRFYGIPTVFYTGSGNWGLSFVLNLEARIAQLPRTINRTISYNCKTQRAESTKTYRVYSLTQNALLPTWKKNELEDAFHAPLIYVEGRPYQFASGTVVSKVGRECWDLFKVDATLQDCTIRVDHGCGEPCSVVRTSVFAVPGSYRMTGFYDQNRVPFESVAGYYQSFPVVESVTDVSSDYPGTAEAWAVVAHGPVPSFFYYDETRAANRVFAADPGTVSNPVICAMPAVGAITVTTAVCATPDIGTISATTTPTEGVEFTWLNGWVEAGGSYGVKAGDTVMMYLQGVNTDLAAPGGETVTLTGDVIGRFAANGWPATPQTVYLGTDTFMTIDSSGFVRYSGAPTTVGTADSEIFIDSQFYYYG